MFFLVRSFVCIAVVYLLVAPETPSSALRRPGGDVMPSPWAGVKLDAATLLALSRAGGGAPGAALRDYCLASPRDCVDMLRQRAPPPH